MVTAVRRGKSIRQTAMQFGVNKATVERWVKVAKGKRLDRVDWEDRKNETSVAWNRTSDEDELVVLEVRKWLVENSPLGEHGADAILREMKNRGYKRLPSRATINRILARHDALEARQRRRYSSPPPGWYLKPVRRGIAELDQFDYVEDLTILGGTNVEVFNAISLHGGLAGSWPMSRMSAENTVQKLIAFWKQYGCPDFAQFDNSTVFQGPRHADSLGRVIRLCLSLGVTPVFAPPGETGFQAAIESYNGRWQRGVWKRFHFEDIPAVCRQSDLYVAAVNAKNWDRFAASPIRWQIPDDWQLDYSQQPRGKVIFIRRTTDDECLDIIGHRWLVPGAGPHKLVRAEVNLTTHRISFYRLSRRNPTVHEYLGYVPYRFPNKVFKAD